MNPRLPFLLSSIARFENCGTILAVRVAEIELAQ